MAELKKGYWVQILPCERPDGALALALIARRTYKISVDSVEIVPLPDEEQPPLLEEDRRDEGKPDKAPPTLEAELVPEKPKVDVIVLGKALAPGGKAAPSFECAVQVGERRERLRIWGPRRALWQPPKKEGQKYVDQLPRFTEPEPIKELPLSWLHAYGGKSWWVQDEAALAMAAKVNPIVEAENAEKAVAQAARKEQKQKEAAQKAKEDKINAVFAEKDAAAKQREEKLKLGDGSEGFDEEGVRLWGASASKDGTAVLSLEEFEKQQLAEMVKLEREAAEKAEAEAKAAALKKLRRNADGEWIEVDDGAEILSDEQLAKELAEAKKQQEQAAKALADEARKRAREQVQQAGGTKVLNLDELGLEDDDSWPKDLKEELDEQDASGKKAREKAEIERKKAEEAALAQYPSILCPTNPYGKGFCLSNHKAVLQRVELPQIEHPDAPLTPQDLVRDIARLDEVPFAYGFGVLPRHARPRVTHFGPLPSGMVQLEKGLEEYKKTLDLEDEEQVKTLRALDQQGKPAGMKPNFYNGAAPGMQWHDLRGDEAVTLTNLSKEGTLYFKLPGKVLTGELDRGRGIERKDLHLDTLIIETEPRTVTLLWRTQFSLSSWEEIATYPHMVGWVLDLDVQARRDNDWADRLKAAQGEGTAMLDVSNLFAEDELYDARKSAPREPARDEHGVLELPKEGSYLRAADDDQWVKDAAAGVRDLDGEAQAKRAAAEYEKKKKAALDALAKAEKEEADRRKEVAEAIQAGQPVPPKGGVPGQKKPKK